MVPNITPIPNVNKGYTVFSNTACGLDVKMAMKKNVEINALITPKLKVIQFLFNA